jgi:hypothetical protein
MILFTKAKFCPVTASDSQPEQSPRGKRKKRKVRRNDSKVGERKSHGISEKKL